MAEIADKRQIYYIPDNYISESRVHIGQMTIRVRYLIDSLILTAILGVFAVFFIMFAMPNTGTSAKLTVAIIVCGPGFVLGQIGYNGDPISTTIKNLLAWRKNNESGRDTMVEVYANFRESMRKNAEEGEMVEGENFEFQFDPGIDSYLDENGDYEDGSDPDSFELEIDSEPNIENIRFVFSSDGYFEPDEESINLSDFETD